MNTRAGLPLQRGVISAAVICSVDQAKRHWHRATNTFSWNLLDSYRCRLERCTREAIVALRVEPGQEISAIRDQLQSFRDGPLQAGTPDHPITIAPAGGRIRVTFAGRTVASSDAALTLTEASYAPVYYLPPEHVDFAVLERTEHRTRCPYKGEASYYSIHAAGRTAQNAVWSYEQPSEGVAAIAGYLAFYPDRVDNVEKLSE